ncbi:Zinc knuckle [Carex littledalei]|uniref:Zinc knuckle n=1 Tax=Carex littledalei TaxID=544730 RepID=A0A833REV5_9POAL|nr:Zinc knuckle [Carex littledalei]
MAANAEVEAVDFDSEDEDLMDDDTAAADADPSPMAPAPKLRSAITGGDTSSGAPRKTKGCGFRERDEASADRSSRFTTRDFNSLAFDGGRGPQRSSSLMLSNPFEPLPDLEPSLCAISHVVATIVEKIQRPSQQPYKQPPLHQVKSEVKFFWRKSNSQGEQQCRLDRTEIVRSKIKELRRLSSPSQPFCFRCGDCGHRALDCCNDVLCYTCNRLGHRSSQCHAVIERPPHIPPKFALTVKPQPLIPSNIRSGSGQQSIPVYYEVSIMDSIKRMETKLAEIKQELVLMKKRSSEPDYQQPQKEYDNNNQSGNTNKGNTPLCIDDAMTIGNDPRCNLESDANMFQEIETFIQDDKIIIEVEKHQSEVHPTYSLTVETSSERPAGKCTNKDCRTVPAQRVEGDVCKDLVPVTPMNQGSWLNQIARTNIKKAKSSSRELNRVALPRKQVSNLNEQQQTIERAEM